MAGAGVKEATPAPSFLHKLVAEREPSVEKLIAERDPKALDAEFYTGLFIRVQAEVKRELALERLRRETHLYDRRHRYAR